MISVVVASAAASNSATACAGEPPGVPCASLGGAALVVGGGLGDAGHGHTQLERQQRFVGDEVDDDVVDGPAVELGRVDRAGPVVDRQVAQQQDGPCQLDAVDIGRRGAGNHHRRRSTAACLGEYPGT